MKTYSLNLDESEIRYLLQLISVAEDVMIHGNKHQRAMVNPDSKIKPKIMELVSNNINLQTYFSKPYDTKPKYQYQPK